MGRDTLHLVDRERKDPWVPTADRELLLSLHYPALARTGTPAPYMSVPEARALLTDRGQLGEYVNPSGSRPPGRTRGRTRCPDPPRTGTR